jgi:hypothetical protein
MRRAVARLRRIPLPAVAGAAAVLVVAAVALHWMLPWLTRPNVARLSTPVPPATFGLTTIEVKPRHEACVTGVMIPAEAQLAGFGGSVPSGKPAPPVQATVSGPGGYVARGRAPHRWPGGLWFGFRSPPHDLVGQICLRNMGKVAFVLNSTTQATRSRSTLDGRAVPTTASLELRHAGTPSRLEQLGTTIDRAVAFSWRPFTGGIGRLLALLVVLLVPAGAIGALVWAMALDGREPRR